MLPEPGGPSMHPKRASDPDVAEISASAPDSMASGIGCLEAQCLSPEEANDCSTKMFGKDEAMGVHTKRLLDSEMQSVVQTRMTYDAPNKLGLPLCPK